MVSGLPPTDDWGEEDFLGVFETAGEVCTLTLHVDDRGKRTGTAVVLFDTADGARAAVSDLNGA
eukprot:gene32485-67273_t